MSYGDFRMKKSVIALMCGLSMLCMNKAGAESISPDDVLITAARGGVLRSQIPTTVTVITENDLREKNAATVSDVLREVPGLAVTQQGGPGKTSSVFIRGAESRHTLVLIDGIRVNSPTMGGFDFADMNVNDIERIEIIRAPLSTLYGSDAMGGVIQIFTKKAHTTSGTVTVETGSFDTKREDVSTSLKADRYDLHVSASHLETEGFSTSSTGNEKDGYRNTTISSKMGISAGATGRIDISARLTESNTDLDGFGIDDPNYKQQRQWNLLGINYSSSLNSNWDQRLTLTSSDDEFVYTDDDTPWNRGQFNSRVDTANWQHNIHSDDGAELTIGYERMHQLGDIPGSYNKKVDNSAVYIQDQRGLKSPVQLLAGLRWDDSTIYDSAFTYRAGITHTPANGVKWFAQYGTGFKGPNLNDLFRPEDLFSIGNPNLKPEKSKGWEIGTEQVVSGSSSVSVSYFKNSYEDIIQWLPNTAGKYQPQNRRKALSDGVEASIVWQSGQMLRIEGTYTYNDTEDSETHFYLQRRPLNKYGVVLLVNPSGNLRMTINFNHSGRRVEWADTDFDGKPDRQKVMSAYSKVDLSGSYKLSRTIEIFFRIENLLDENYTEAIGYNTAGVSSYSGARITL
ncbi:MAG: TonB-dependent receptor [Nitrospirae bacterium]|nr:TonB-dependent receptor [Nitrospirota bacterium]